MKPFSRHPWGPTAIAALALCAASGAATAQTDVAPKTGYLTDSSNAHVMAGNGVDCWRTGEWTAAQALEPCDPVVKKATVAQITVVPQAAAPASVPAPAPAVAAPLPVVPLRFSYAADVLFGFDKASLGLHARQVLDSLSDQLKTVQTNGVMVTGHTDRLGSNAYNQTLSERRALAVRDYLAANGFAAADIQARGMGESQPATAAQDCTGAPSVQLINCLRADRRVEIDVQGSQIAAP